MLTERGVRRRIAGELIETPGLRYGVHVNFGDLVSVSEDGEVFNCRLLSVTTRIDGGVLTRTIRLRNV